MVSSEAARSKPCYCVPVNKPRSHPRELNRAIITPVYLPALPESPALFKAAKTSFPLKSPVTSKDSAPLAAVFPFTPATLVNASFTLVTHLLQQRCTPVTLSD